MQCQSCGELLRAGNPACTNCGAVIKVAIQTKQNPAVLSLRSRIQHNLYAIEMIEQSLLAIALGVLIGLIGGGQTLESNGIGVFVMTLLAVIWAAIFGALILWGVYMLYIRLARAGGAVIDVGLWLLLAFATGSLTFWCWSILDVNRLIMAKWFYRGEAPVEYAWSHGSKRRRKEWEEARKAAVQRARAAKEQPLPSDIEKLLEGLNAGLAYTRREAAAKLSSVTISHPRIVTALRGALNTDNDTEVRSAAMAALAAMARQNGSQLLVAQQAIRPLTAPLSMTTMPTPALPNAQQAADPFAQHQELTESEQAGTALILESPSSNHHAAQLHSTSVGDSSDAQLLTECSICNTAVAPGAIYCPGCGHDFATGKEGTGPFSFAFPAVHNAYRPSGVNSLAATLLMLIFGSATGIVGGIAVFYVHQLIGSWFFQDIPAKISLFKLLVVFMGLFLVNIGLVTLIGFAISQAIDRAALLGKGRNEQVAKTFSIICALVGYAAYFTPYFARYGAAGFNSLPDLLRMIVYLAAITVPAYRLSGRVIQTTPFCEACSLYMTKNTYPKVPIAYERQLLDALRARDFMRTVGFTDARCKADKNYSQLTFWHCDSCRKHGFFNAETKQVRYKYEVKDRKGQRTEQTQSRLIYSSAVLAAEIAPLLPNANLAEQPA
jgi:hypothetical protein